MKIRLLEIAFNQSADNDEFVDKIPIFQISNLTSQCFS